MHRLPVREAPAASPLYHGTDAAFPDVVNRDDPPPEPELAVDQIQGNIIGGFMKDFQTLLFLRIDERGPFKDWLRSQIDFIATAAQVVAFNRNFKQMRFLEKVETGALKATWFNIAFSLHALRRLAGDDVEEFDDEAFKAGLLAQSRQGVLGDPRDEDDLAGSPENWVIGGEGNEADVILIVAADERCDMLDEVARVKASLAMFKSEDGEPAVTILFEEEGANLPQPLSGHEHFGFLDGVSQPGLRGRISDVNNDVLTPRQNPEMRDQPPFTQEGGEPCKGKSAQGKPGQDLLWPGEFVFGYQEQNPEENPAWDGPNPIPNPEPPLLHPHDRRDRRVSLEGIAPEWARDGSFLVFRRLEQDVFAFHCFLHRIARVLEVPDPPAPDPLRAKAPTSSVRCGDEGQEDGEGDGEQNGQQHGDSGGLQCPGSARALVGAKLVGRWPSGAPVVRNPDRDSPAMADDDCANNDFEFRFEEEQDCQPTQMSEFDCEADATFPPEAFPKEDQEDDGSETGRCPFSAHIRKAYPRNDEPLVTDGSAPDRCDARAELNESSTQTHRILRRGIPFGEVSRSTPDAPVDDRPPEGRGLHFLAYMTSIEDQFEFIIRCWVNNPNFKEPVGPAPSDIDHPIDVPIEEQGGGHDPVIGQNAEPGEDRVRVFTITFRDEYGNTQARRVSTRDFPREKRDWVIPTGGGYFFAPSIRAICDVLSVRSE